MDKKSLALLIDADNMPASLLPDILAKASEFGEPSVRRAFGDFSGSRLAKWVTACRDNGLETVTQTSAGKGKNSTDMVIAIHAMDLLYAGHLHGLCIASSDCDFIALAARIRASGIAAYGLGGEKASNALRKAFTRFVDVRHPEVETAPPPAKKSNSERVAKLFASAGSDQQWLDLPTLKRAQRQLADPVLDDLLGGKGKFLKHLRATE